MSLLLLLPSSRSLPSRHSKLLSLPASLCDTLSFYTHRHTDTQTHGHTDTQTHRHTDTHTDTHRHTQLVAAAALMSHAWDMASCSMHAWHRVACMRASILYVSHTCVLAYAHTHAHTHTLHQLSSFFCLCVYACVCVWVGGWVGEREETGQGGRRRALGAGMDTIARGSALFQLRRLPPPGLCCRG